MKNTAIAILVLAFTLALAGCNGNDSPTAPTRWPAGEATASVSGSTAVIDLAVQGDRPCGFSSSSGCIQWSTNLRWSDHSNPVGLVVADATYQCGPTVCIPQGGCMTPMCPVLLDPADWAFPGTTLVPTSDGLRINTSEPFARVVVQMHPAQ